MINDENIKKNQQNTYGELALIMASEKGHKEIVEMLLQDENIEINQTDQYGNTALIKASKLSSTDDFIGIVNIVFVSKLELKLLHVEHIIVFILNDFS